MHKYVYYYFRVRIWLIIFVDFMICADRIEVNSCFDLIRMEQRICMYAHSFREKY